MATDALYIPPPPADFASTHSSSVYAGFWIRVLAFLVDLVVIALASNLLAGWLHTDAQTVGLLFGLVYFSFCFSKFGHGATLGYRLFGLQVVGSDGNSIGLLHALARTLSLPISFSFLYLGVIWVAFDPRKQGWHDKLARTFILRG
jgi:uncharacterized RDD family membrane protein YckC